MTKSALKYNFSNGLFFYVNFNLFSSLCLSLFLSTSESTGLSIYLSTYLFIYLSIYLPIFQFILRPLSGSISLLLSLYASLHVFSLLPSLSVAYQCRGFCTGLFAACRGVYRCRVNLSQYLIPHLIVDVLSQGERYCLVPFFIASILIDLYVV